MFYMQTKGFPWGIKRIRAGSGDVGGAMEVRGDEEGDGSEWETRSGFSSDDNVRLCNPIRTTEIARSDHRRLSYFPQPPACPADGRRAR